MEIRVEHELEPAEVARRLASAAARHAVEHDAGDETRGRLVLVSPLGRAEATYRIETAVIVMNVVERPALLSDEMVRRAIERRLRGLLA